LAPSGVGLITREIFVISEGSRPSSFAILTYPVFLVQLALGGSSLIDINCCVMGIVDSFLFVPVQLWHFSVIAEK
jgi:hypothetical protein